MKYVFICLGFIFLGLGILGIYLPLMPATPFLLLATYFFAKGSDKFHHWFINTKIYKDNIEPLKDNRGMTLKRKLRILAMISLFIGISFYLVDHKHARICLILVLLFHYYYFFAKIKSKKDDCDV